jgi:Na+-translocating ferredoxin:NAD+ oxidoreductase RnfA subunit
MERSGGFDMSKLSNADKLVLGGAGLYFIWIFLPFWYSCCTAFGVSADLGGANGLRGVLIIGWILSVVAIAEILLTKIGGTSLNLPAKRGQIHMIVGAAAAVFTLLGLVAKSTGLTLSWGIFVGLIFSLVWAYGGYMMNSEPDAAAPPAAPGGTDGGFTA